MERDRTVGQTRTPNDVVALCVELLRAVREQDFQTRGAGGRAPSVDRAWRAWRTDLDRNGALELHAAESGVRAAADGPPLGRGRLEELGRRMRERGLPRLGFEPGLDAPTYGALVSLLVSDPASVAEHGGAASFLPERGVGIALPAGDAIGADPEAKEDDAAPAHEPAAEALEGEVTALERLRLARDDERYGEALTAVVAELNAANRAREADAGPDAEPDAPEASDATRHADETLRTLARHASARGDRSEAQRKQAREALVEICTGKRLADLIARATSADAEENHRATEILLQLAGDVATALLSAIDVQHDGQKREELLGITIALGRAATPALRRAMEGSSEERARIAARIAGEIRDERAVPTLTRLLDHRDEGVRSEAARALARVGNEKALTALTHGLESSREDVAALCAYCLGVTGRAEAATALTDTLRDARRARRIGLATAVIRSLGRLGREESVPELRRILRKRSFFRRQELQELKLQAVAALGRLPGEPAREALVEVASGEDMSLAVAARRAMSGAPEGGPEAGS